MSVVCSLRCAVCRGQDGKKLRPTQLSPSIRHRSQSFVHLSDSLIAPSLLGKRPAPIEGSRKQKVDKPLFSAESNRCLGVLCSHRPFSAEPMKESRKEQGPG